MHALARTRRHASSLTLITAVFGCGVAASDPGVGGASVAAGGAATTIGSGGATSSNGATSGSGASAGKSAATAGSGNQGAAGASTSTGSGARVVDCTHDGDGKTTLAFVNGCSQPITFQGSDITGGTLAAGAFACVDIGSDVDAINSKRYWGFSGEDPGAEHHSLAEFTFNTDFQNFDWYNISYVDAFNLPLQIVPLARPKCDTLTCAQDWLSVCPAVGQYEDATGEVVACVSPDRNNADSPVAQLFEGCDDAYAWSGDDQKGTDPSPVRACAGEDFEIVFCPEAEP